MTTKNTAKEAATEIAGKDFIKPTKGWDEGKDWSYLAEKEPDSSHYLKAHMLLKYGPQEGMPEMTVAEAAKVVQVFLSMHRWMQQSDLNQSRDDFRGRTWESVQKGYQTLAEKAAERLAENPTARMVEAPRAVTGLTADEVLKEIVKQPDAPEEAKEVAKEALAGAEPKAEPKTEPAKEEPKAEEKPTPKPRQRRAPRKTPAKTAAADLKVGADS